MIVCGKLTKYKDTPETLSNQSYIYSLNGETAGIETLSIQRADGIIYNLSGQRVVTPAKGIYIKDGRKFIVK